MKICTNCYNPYPKRDNQDPARYKKTKFCSVKCSQDYFRSNRVGFHKYRTK